MPGDYCCLLCSKNISYAGKKKHLFSKRHLLEIQNGILKARGPLERWISEYDQGKKNHIRDCIPPIILSPGKIFVVCIPCKHIGPTIKGHSCSQEAMKQNIEYYKNALQQTIQIPRNVPEIKAPPVNSDEIEKLQRKIDRFKRDIDKLNEVAADAESKSEKAEMFLDSLKYWVSFVKEDNRELYDTIMSNFREEFSEMVGYIKN